MGGCRCSYRNCSLRSDGKTHMFHYPVFDKVRCHQWLTNAQKLEFLNLKVSQLKNRVVCQNHFRDEHFMNFKKDKLTFDAVPTEDGPYCDSSQLTEDLSEPDVGKVYTITLDDIENEYMTLSDKRANFTVKYGDFLTNCDLMDLDNLNHNYNTQIDCKGKVEVEVGEPASIILNDIIDRTPYSNVTTLADVKSRDMRRCKKQPTVGDKMKLKYDKPSVVRIQFEEVLDQPNPENTHQGADVRMLNDINILNETMSQRLSKDKKIKIISEQMITEPVPVTGTLETLSPSTVLPLPNKKKIIKTNVVDTKDIKDAMIEISIDNILQNNVVPPDNTPVTETSTEQLKKPQSPRVKNNNTVNKMRRNEVQTNRTLLRGKSMIPQVSPERVAAIEQKRKFNMKLRDIIETCLDKIDDQEKISENTKYLENLKSKVNQQQQVASHLSTEPKLPHINEYAINYLEDKIKKMEDNLIHKIGQNSSRIMDLKKSLSPRIEKKSVHTQTSVNEELHKKHLYQELSKYLSPDANNLIYEELFINKYVQNVPKILPSGKRRKYR